MITNSGSQRFDIYAGPFTKNDQLTASPFADAFQFIPNVTLSLAVQVLPALNKAGAEGKRSLREFEREQEMYGRGYVDQRYQEWLEDMYKRGDNTKRDGDAQTPGYVTHDVRAISFENLLAPSEGPRL